MECAFHISGEGTECGMFRDVLYAVFVCPCPAVFVVRGCGVLEEVYRCFAIVICFSVVNVLP